MSSTDIAIQRPLSLRIIQTASLPWCKLDGVIIRFIYGWDMLCDTVIPGTNEIGAKLTQWITITDWLANLIVMDASAGAVLSLNTRLTHVFCEKLQEKLVKKRCNNIIYKCTQRMIFAAVSTSLWAALMCI